LDRSIVAGLLGPGKEIFRKPPLRNIPMSLPPRKIALLGSTGSIGCATLDVIDASAGQFQIVVLSAHQRLGQLCEQAARYRPRFVVASDAAAARQFDWRLPTGTELLIGPEGVQRAVALKEIDIVVAAVVGSAGLLGTWAALEAGKTVAIANKEALVMAGPQIMRLAADRRATVLPIDSEHSAIFQLLDTATATSDLRPPIFGHGSLPPPRRPDVRRIILTASGGPFRSWSAAEMQTATVADALAHPTWRMGQKITIDSATMMNKALEMIEARWLFDLVPDQIDVVIHPQSIVHSLVEFIDGSVVAQLSPPDMRLPIQFALTWPQRGPSPAKKLDLTQPLRLDFEPPDEDRFPALALGREVAAAGGTAGAVLNAANEAAVARFVAGEMPFTEIVPACRAALENHSFSANPTLDELLKLDAWARQETEKWILA
jgi:1-deoxy-D-xylulose-5-phosphate reductoisomerase